jgi:16S rRNA (guanine1207-N2)-methyltransferase
MPQYFEEQEGPLVPHCIRVKARGIGLELWSGNGMFSKDELDTGTKLLIDECTLEPGWHVHDLGCGIGVVGVLIWKSEPTCTVLCSDVSSRAIELTKRNVGLHAPNIIVRQSDGYAAIPEIFDTVLLNPPYVAGRQVIYRLIDEAHEHLRPGGLLQLVARHNKGGETLKKRMIEVFGNCDDVNRRNGFRIYISRRDATDMTAE